jgi:cardiolipin synthase
MDVIWTFSALLLVLAAGIACSAHALLHKHEPRAAFGWIAVCLLVPLLGPFLYVLFGVNRVQNRADKLFRGVPAVHLGDMYGSDACPGEPGVPKGYLSQARLSCAVTGRRLSTGNALRPLYNGEEAFPEMLAAMAAAKERLYLSTYIFDADATGRKFIAALADASKRGVDVRVIIDGIGERYSRPWASTLLEAAGVTVMRFLPPRLFPPSISVNLRNHRKILAIDGQTAFTGGMNIGDRHLAADRRPNRVVDLHFKVQGPAAVDMESMFLRDWAFVSNEVQHASKTEEKSPGNAACRLVVDGPDDEIGVLSMVLAGAVASAGRRVRIMSPYFLPGRELVTALTTSALRGVDVHIALPQVNNLPMVHWATRNMLGELLVHGVKVSYHPGPYPEQPLFVHTKLLLVDEDYVQLGSANLDPRSLRLNFELNLEVYDAALNRDLSRHFDEVLAHSRPVTLQELQGRPLGERFRDAFFWLFSPYL